ncbi:MAG: hypothetical protein DSY55_05290 [Clostridia bacterium]|nr:MAG: hypothetical protein DSY55_05290 [Clostridia bacterium]
MHPVRQNILEYLKRYGQATVIELANHLNMAPISVRHHLDLLIGDNLVEASRVRRHEGAGRPRRLYALTSQADALFPNNYQKLAEQSLTILKQTLPPEVFLQVMNEMATDIVAGVPANLDELTPEERIQTAVQLLNEEGYMAFCDCDDEVILLHTCHCPYKNLVKEHPEICHIDDVLIRKLTGMTPVRITHMATGDIRCTYKLVAVEAARKPGFLTDAPAKMPANV